MDIQTIFFDLGETLVTSPRLWLPGAQALLASLKQKGVRLGIISNTGKLAPRQTILDILPTDFDMNLFEPALVLFSSEVGIKKPRKEIFEIEYLLITMGSSFMKRFENVIQILDNAVGGPTAPVSFVTVRFGAGR
jgi:hypothetical protein